MNKFITPIPAGGIPIVNEDFLMLQNEAHEAINAICAGVDSGFVIKGCEATTSTTNVTITAGIVYLDNQVMRFDGYTGAYPVYIKAGTATKTQRVFKDGIVKDATTNTLAVAVTAVPASGTYITFNPQPNKTLKSAITGALSDKLTKEINDRIAADNSITSVVNGKADKAQQAIQTPTLKTGYTGGWNGDTVGYFKDTLGFVHLFGTITASGVTGSIFTLPEGYRPPVSRYFGNKTMDTAIAMMVNVSSNGLVNCQAAGNTSFTLNGCSFYVG